MTVYPPLPEQPACWSWPSLPLPQMNSRGPLLRWQADRCAICEIVRTKGSRDDGRQAGLVEDHDHATGDVRGYLCHRCNTSEGRSPAAVFALYRERPPTAILGLRLRKNWFTHPDDRAADIAWENALCRLEMDERELFFPNPGDFRVFRGPFLPRAFSEPMTPLMAAAARVGMTVFEWWDSVNYTRDVAYDLSRGQHPRPHPYWEKAAKIRGTTAYWKRRQVS